MRSSVLARLTSSFFAGARRFTTSDVASPVSSGAKLAALAGVVGGALAIYVTTEEAEASFGYAEECLPAPKFPWRFESMWKSYDHAAIRRGFQVYQTIGSACHSMKYMFYRQLINVAYTAKEMKEIAAEHTDYPTPPDDEGEVSTRAGTIDDHMWQPYKNEKEARYTNNGALPPDLSLIIKAREDGVNYVFALLTGYRDVPHGIKMGENMYYNLYFPGQQLAMPPPLAEGAVEYEDGTEASVSQMAKDVTEYLAWSSSPEMDERHLMGLKTFATITAFAGFFFYIKKFRWSYIKHRVVQTEAPRVPPTSKLPPPPAEDAH